MNTFPEDLYFILIIYFVEKSVTGKCQQHFAGFFFFCKNFEEIVLFFLLFLSNEGTNTEKAILCRHYYVIFALINYFVFYLI